MAAVDSRGPSPVPSDSFSVHESVWIRELTDDGRVFFFNRSTGASQWHIPTDLYRNQCLKTPEPWGDDGGVDGPIAMPATARAVLKVDVMTEYLGNQFRTGVMDNVLTKGQSFKYEDEDKPVEIPLKAVTRCKVLIKGARGLRDVDFMPGKDKSDPACSCELVGKPDSQILSPVISDCLDPVWDFEGLLEGYKQGDMLRFVVKDVDSAAQVKAAKKNAAAVQEDEILGILTLFDDDLIMEEPREYRLEEAGKGIEAFITVQVSFFEEMVPIV